MVKGSSSSSSSSGGGGDSLNGLKFGKKIYFKGGGGVSPEAAPPQPKKGRSGVVQGGRRTPRCQVEGCKVDLNEVKPYYCRHKVCSMHSKSPKVIVDGLEQRFCQQCSRFHQLPEFDQGKRSCRRRLAGHNERRRKPPPVPLMSSHHAILSPSAFDNHNKSGGFVMDFSAGGSTFASQQGLVNQTGKHQLSWQSNSKTRVNGGVTSALSLLSNEPWGSRTQPLSLGANNFLAATNDGASVVHQFVDPGQFSWDFKANNSLHQIQMPPDMGLQQISHSSSNNSHHQYRGDIASSQSNNNEHYRALEPSGAYDSSVQQHMMNWFL